MIQNLPQKYARLLKILTDLGSCLVAYSGGVDSTLLLFTAREALGKDATGILIDSPLLSKREKASALDIANELKVPLLIVHVDPFQNEHFIENGRERCYFCKKFLFKTIRTIAKENGFTAVCEGSNVDDLSDFRPGRKALQEMGIISPLVDAGFTKEAIRQISREKNLPNWNQPSLSCLATRIPYGTPVTIDRLQRIEKAEDLLHQMGFQQLRVRDHDTIARIEVPLTDMTWILTDTHRQKITNALKSCGYQFITLDLEGFRSGSMNSMGIGKSKNEG